MQFTHTLYKLVFLEIIFLANLPVFIPKLYSSIRVIYHLLISDHFKFKDEQVRRKIPSLQALICFESAARHASYTYAAQELF